MKLFSSVVLSALFAFSTSSQADTTPDLLKSLSKNSIQVMSKTEVSKIRGEYWVTAYVKNGLTGAWSSAGSYPVWSQTPLQTGWTQTTFNEAVNRQHLFNWGSYYVSK